MKEKLVLEERRISLSEFHTADEVFVFYVFNSKLNGLRNIELERKCS